jgi:hypothetical protein
VLCCLYSSHVLEGDNLFRKIPVCHILFKQPKISHVHCWSNFCLLKKIETEKELVTDFIIWAKAKSWSTTAQCNSPNSHIT